MVKKMRVYELAQKMGLDNKALLDKLHLAGIDAKSHMSVLNEDEMAKIEAESVDPVEKVEEQRITPGVIRRRRKEVPQAADQAVAPVAEEEQPVAEPEPAPATKPAAPEVPKEEQPAPVIAVSDEARPPVEPVVEPVALESAEEKTEPQVEPELPEMPVATPAEPVKAEKPVLEKPAAPAVGSVEPEAKVAGGRETPPVAQKATANRAKILGRVELSTLAPPPAKEERRAPAGRGTERPARERQPRPARPAPAAPGTMPPAMPEIPLEGKEGRGVKKAKKGKAATFDKDRSVRDEGKARRTRREVYEPEHEDWRGGRRGKKAPKVNKKTEVTVSKAIKRVIRISDVITVAELAKRMGIKGKDLIKELMRQGTMVTINHPLDFETAAILASEFNYEVENIAFDEELILEDTSDVTVDEVEEHLQTRPPVVTIMGHVDHGKTSLLDAIRTTNVTAGEAGGITQHIGAYDVEIGGRKITFLDTPGHEAFTAMRARGAQVTDIVILVVAADDGVMPQTKEAISHAQAASVPIIVAINKIDKPDAKPERVMQELTEFGMVPESWGGETIFVEVSAKEKINLNELLEMVLLQAEVLDLKASPAKRAKGVIVEARLDRGRGPVATVLVQEGTLRIGDPIVSGTFFGRVRTMTNDKGQRLEDAGPSCPVEVTGLSGTPTAGESFYAVETEKAAKEVASHRERKLREQELATTSKFSLEQLYARLQGGEVKELKVIIKADVQGSVEAVRDSLLKLSTDACRLVVIHAGVGGITEGDVSLAAASDGIILGFNVRPETKAALQAETDGVDIRLYTVIYDAVADIRNAMEGLLAPTLRERHLGNVEVRETFNVSRVGTIAGCYVTQGKVLRNAQVRLIRDNIVIWTGKLASLKRFKDDAREVASGYECGISLENYNDIKVGDVIEVFEVVEEKTAL